MRAARVLLLLCLGVGLGSVWFAARGHLREARLGLERSETRALRAELRDRGRALAEGLRAQLAASPIVATYDPRGRLVRPAPPAEARRWRAPEFLLGGSGGGGPFLETLDLHAHAAALVHQGMTHGDPASLRRALTFEVLRGTDYSYRVRLEVFRLEKKPPDAVWIDDVSALLGGKSDRFARALLKEAGVVAVLSRAMREELASLRVRPGISADRGNLQLVARAGDHLTLKRLAIAALDTGAGAVAVPLPAPFAAVSIRGEIDAAAVRARLHDEQLETAGLYGLAAVILMVGTVYAHIAIGRASRLAQAKSDFVANITHELKTPLANIRLYGESLQGGRVREEDKAEFVATILEETHRLDQLVEGLLHAAHGPQMKMTSLAPRGLLEEAERRWRPRLEGDGYALTLQAPDLPSIRGDKEALLRALDNLLDNARKYSTDDRRVELAGTATDGTVRLTVRDHGPGIPAQDRDRVCRPFTRLESADRKETPGTGLGLSLVVSCMEAHGGRLEIDGNAVTMILPEHAA